MVSGNIPNVHGEKEVSKPAPYRARRERGVGPVDVEKERLARLAAED